MSHTPAQLIAKNLTRLQLTYVELLENQQTEAYEEVGVTLRAYVEALALMGSLSASSDDDAESEDYFQYEEDV